MPVIPTWALVLGWTGVVFLTVNVGWVGWSWGLQPVQLLHHSTAWRSYLKQEGLVGFAIACQQNRACQREYQRLQPQPTPQDLGRLWPLILLLAGFGVKQPSTPRKAPGAARWATRKDVTGLYHERLPPP